MTRGYPERTQRLETQRRAIAQPAPLSAGANQRAFNCLALSDRRVLHVMRPDVIRSGSEQPVVGELLEGCARCPIRQPGARLLTPA